MDRNDVKEGVLRLLEDGQGKTFEEIGEFLRKNGFPSVKNLTGGIDAWAERIDTTLPRY